MFISLILSSSSISHIFVFHFSHQQLLQKYTNTPLDPYITVDPRFSPSQVQLLIDEGIAEAHPTRPNQLRLVNFALDEEEMAEEAARKEAGLLSPGRQRQPPQ